jgi:hypothetical protein
MRGTPSGTPDVAGTWTGTLKGKGFDQTGLFLNASFKDLVTLSVTQTGSTLGITVIGDQTLEGVSLTGEIGNGTFWVSGVRAGSGLPTLLSGHVNLAGTSMKAAGVTLSADPLLYEVVELKLKAKKIL